MEKLSVDWKRFENFANRALLIILHLYKIAEENYQKLINAKNIGERTRVGYDKIVSIGDKTIRIEAYEYREIFVIFGHLESRLKYYYSNFKGIMIAMEKLIKINEEIKYYIKQIESKVEDDIRFQISGRGNINWDYIAEEIRRQGLHARDEEISVGVLEGRLERIFNDLKEDTVVIIGQKNLFSIDEQSKARFFVYWRKLVGIFDEIDRLLKRGEPQAKFIRERFDEVYSLLSHFPKEHATTGEIELAIQKLEQIYGRM